MKEVNFWSPKEQYNDEHKQEDTVKLRAIKNSGATGTFDEERKKTADSAKDATMYANVPIEKQDTVKLEDVQEAVSGAVNGELDDFCFVEVASFEVLEPGPADPENCALSAPDTDTAIMGCVEIETSITATLPQVAPRAENSMLSVSMPQRTALPRGRAILLAVLLLILVINTSTMSFTQFIGPQGWAYVLGGPVNTSNPDLLSTIANQLHHKLTPGTTTQATQPITPQEYINLIVNNMTLDQKLGQMMIVQFYGPDYGLDISTMISQYNVGAALLFTVNDNIQNKNQLRSLIDQMHSNSKPIPLAVAIDQEGGTVDRLVNLDGPRPSATALSATNDPNKVMAQGIQDAQDLAYYGFNLNLAPVVDVNNVYNPQLYLRTFGTNAAMVTKMAGAYLRGLQQSGKVIGTLKHFPGLGDVSADPHSSLPYLHRSLSDLEAIDWAPYRALIQQGNVHAVMVTHEIVSAVDGTKPSSLSYKIVTGILRNQLGFNGVIMTDSLTMEGVLAYATEAQAAALAIEAGSDLLMGASTPKEVGNMIAGIKQAMITGEISQQRIDDSVRRILMLKYEMGLLHIPTA